MSPAPGGVRWWWHRLRAMPPAEVVYRGWRLVRDRLPAPRLVPGAGGGMVFSAEEVASWEDTRARGDAILAGKREVLGLGWIEVPRDPWHLEPLAGREWPRVPAGQVRARAPGSMDPRLTFELCRGHEWVILARAHTSSGDEGYLRELERLLRSFRAHNPVGVGIAWISAMEAAIRVVSLAWTAAFVPALAGETREMVAAHAGFVARNLSRFSSANNHLLVELSALVVAGRSLGLDPLRRRALRELDDELGRQIFPDGVNAEMATHYHLFVLEALRLVAWVERRHGARRARLEDTVGRMAGYVAALRLADGGMLGQGDDDGGHLLPLAWPGQVGKILSVVGGSRRFAESGQIVLRSARLLATFDAGPFGFGSLAAHAHCDALAVNVAVDGRRVLVDRGTFVYNGDPAGRDLFRGTAAHNTLQLDGREQAEAAGPFLWRRRPRVVLERCELGEAHDMVVASHDGFAPARHRRTVERRGDALLIVDEVPGRRHGDGIVVRHHVAPELQVVARGGGIFEAHRDGVSLMAMWLRGDEGRVVETWHSDRYRERRRAATIESAATTTLLVAGGAAGLVAARASFGMGSG